ncbi:hypothetical protein KIW84_014096 [Lathyrus oleraceus]|uniref:Ubiquitin-like protease family profile domain-containing protein n=1 Tax=Pisum sativum TaxID=3888 RepID=A0A9D5BLT2_PEA|nr:hypothetical protein KIW84_014096 [Pisum sativum]
MEVSLRMKRLFYRGLLCDVRIGGWNNVNGGGNGESGGVVGLLPVWTEKVVGVFRRSKKRFKMTNEYPAHRQDNGWACGYYVMKTMFDIVDASIVEIFNEISTDTSSYEKETIDSVRQLWAQCFSQMVEEQMQIA